MMGRRINYIVKVPCLNNRLYYTSSKKKIEQWDAIITLVVVGYNNRFYKLINGETKIVKNLPYCTKQNMEWLLNYGNQTN